MNITNRTSSSKNIKFYSLIIIERRYRKVLKIFDKRQFYDKNNKNNNY